MAPAKKKSVNTTVPKTNEKGEITSWDSGSLEGKALRALFDSGVITDQTAKHVKKEHTMFRQFCTRTLNSALSNERKRLEKEVDTQKARGSSVMKSHSNLNINLGTIQEDGSYKSAEDDDYDPDDDDDDVSQLSDEFSYDTHTTAFKSTAFKAKTKRAAAIKAGKEVGEAPVHLEKISGNTKIGLPYILDMWRDCMSKARASVQVQMLSGKDAYKKVFVRVSTDGKELVLTLPMSPYLSHSDFAFNSFLLSSQPKATEMEQHYLKVLLKHHPKAAGRMVAVSKVKGRSNTAGFFYEQRTKDGDNLFYGKKFIQYPDGSVFLHVELVAESKDNYIPEERMLDPSVIKTVPKMPAADSATPMDTETAHVLPEEQKVSQSKRPHSSVPVVKTVTEDDESIDDSSRVTGPQASAAAAANAEAEAIAEAGAAKAQASVLGQPSSLQAAVEQGQAAANATEN